MASNFQKGYTNLLIPLILILGLLAGVFLVKQPTNILPKAQDTAPIIEEEGEFYPPDARVSSNGKFGIAIDIQKKSKIPNIDQLQALSPGWVRFVYKPGYKIPNFPDGLKTLVIFNGESVTGVDWYGDLSFWKSYTDKYLDGLTKYLKDNADKVDALEVQNEENLCYEEIDYCAKVPEVIYVSLLKRATAIIKEYSPKTKVIMGGLATFDSFDEDGGYLGRLINLDPNLFDQVDGLGIHPYEKTLNGWCASKEDNCSEVLSDGDLNEAIQRYKALIPPGVKIWITEIGQPTTDNTWQKEYLKMVFDYLLKEAEVIIWYTWTDNMTSMDWDQNMGLFDKIGKLKPAGELFKQYSTSN